MTNPQQQLAEEIESCIELIDQFRRISEADEDKSYEVSAVMLMQAMDRLQQLLATHPAGCDGQTVFAKKEEAP